MNENDKQPYCPECYRRHCVVTVKIGTLKCTKCGVEFHDPRKK